MSERDIAVRDLSRDERDFVIRKLMDAIGASTSLNMIGGSASIMEPAEMVSLLSLSKWPLANATPIELAWLSRPLENGAFPALKGYSVFWCLAETGYEVWIGRSIYKPSSSTAYIRNEELLAAIYEAYGVYVSRKHRADHWFALRRWLLRRWAFLAAAFVVAPAMMMAMLLERLGGRVQDADLASLSPVIAYLVAVSISYGVGKLYGSKATWIIYGSFLIVGAAFVPLITGWEELGQLLGVGASLAVGLGATSFKHWDLLWLPGYEVVHGRFRTTYTITATWALVTATGFGAFKVLRYAIDGAFVDGHVFLVSVICIVILALAEFLRREIIT